VRAMTALSARASFSQVTRAALQPLFSKNQPDVEDGLYQVECRADDGPVETARFLTGLTNEVVVAPRWPYYY
jgi:hypothetical protein